MDYQRIREQLEEAASARQNGEPAATGQAGDTSQAAPPAGTAARNRRAARRRNRSTGATPGTSGSEFTATTNRHAIRQLALLALFELDVTSHPFEEVVQRVIDDPFLSAGAAYGDAPGEAELDLPPEAVADSRHLEQGVRDIVFGVIRYTAEIDRTIVAAAPAFPIGRIGTIDRNVLRLGIYEMEYVREDSNADIVNEAVELGKRFGGDSTASFVNGVLRTISDQIRAAEQ